MRLMTNYNIILTREDTRSCYIKETDLLVSTIKCTELLIYIRNILLQEFIISSSSSSSSYRLPNQFSPKSIFTNPMWIIVLLDCDKFPTRWTLVETFICILALACYKVSLSGIEKGHFISSRTKRERFSEVDPARSKEIRSEVVIEVNQSGPALRRSRSLLKVSR